MAQISASVSIDDQPRPDLLTALVELEVEEHHALASTFRLKLAINRQEQGLWRFLDDEGLRPWSRVGIAVTTGEDEQQLLAGYVTEARVNIEADESGSSLELVGMDATVLMSLEEKIRDWANQKDSDIAQAIFGEYGLASNVEDTQVVHDEAVSTIIQRETDIRFLNRLAERSGFECVVRGTGGFFQSPSLTEPPLPTLAAHFGAETTLTSFEARWDATRGAAVQMAEINTISKETEQAVVERTALRQLGRDLPPAPPSGTSKAFVKHAVPVTQGDIQRRCQALFDAAAWFVEARGEVDTIVYGTVLQTRRVVPIKGVGGPFSGLYYVTSVRHQFSLDRYVQRFTARRNALFSLPEDFPGAGGLPL
jgi:phage protein D